MATIIYAMVFYVSIFLSRIFWYHEIYDESNKSYMWLIKNTFRCYYMWVQSYLRLQRVDANLQFFYQKENLNLWRYLRRIILSITYSIVLLMVVLLFGTAFADVIMKFMVFIAGIAVNFKFMNDYKQEMESFWKEYEQFLVLFLRA